MCRKKIRFCSEPSKTHGEKNPHENERNEERAKRALFFQGAPWVALFPIYGSQSKGNTKFFTNTVLPRLKPHGIISETGFGGPNISRFGYYPTGALSETPSGIISETGIAGFIGDSMVCPAYANFAKWKPDHFLVFFTKICT